MLFCLRNRTGRVRIPQFSVVFLLLLVLVACDQQKAPIHVGFVGGLTGRVAGLGVAGRDGTLLAVEEANSVGGINGRKVVVSVKDDQQNAAVARKVVEELIQEDVAAIVGHMTSSMTSNSLPIINAAKKMMISPTAKSHYFTGKNDYLFRVTPSISFNAKKIATLAFSAMNLKKFAVVYDASNRAFTESWLSEFTTSYEALGGEIIVTSPFLSGSPDLSFFGLAESLVTQRPDALLVLASALDTALFVQQLHKVEFRVPVFTSEWSFTSDLLNYGGRAVEGLISYHSFNAESRRPQYLDYKRRFIKRFGYEPSFASVLSYDATRMLLHALEINPDPEKLKQTMLGMGGFPGLQSDFEFDQYGDVSRHLFKTIIVNGQFKVIE